MSQYFVVKSDFDKAVAQWKRIASEGLEDDILAAAEEAAQDVADQIREAAGDERFQAQVVNTGANVHLVFPQSAFDLEYGNPEKNIPGQRHVLTTVNRMRQENEERFAKLLQQRLWGDR